MKLIIYKGFDTEFLMEIKTNPLVTNSITDRVDVFKFDKKYKKTLTIAIMSMEDDDEKWITYEEYTFIKSSIDDAVRDDGLKIEIYRNNLYPDCYPIPFDITKDLYNEISRNLEDNLSEQSEKCSRYLSIYSSISNINGKLFGCFYNYEYDHEKNVEVQAYYPANYELEEEQVENDYIIFLNEDIDTFLRDYDEIKQRKIRTLGIRYTNGNVSMLLKQTILAYCMKNHIRAVRFNERLEEEQEQENELIEIGKKQLGIKDFEFRKIKFYKNPDIDNSVIEISQGRIIRDIISQAEKAYKSKEESKFRDIFITASTGAGKSVMFQIPAIYLAQKYKKLTIIIEPVKALMQDQRDNLYSKGYTRVASFNSDITQVEKERVLNQIKNGEIDLLYLSPETLLSYSVETIVGNREIGLLIVDEAHIVTTWGVGFRPDYWYLGGYINKVRYGTYKGKNQRIQHFPICAFTATAVNGGEDDSVSDTIISLYMENPIKYIGYVKRENIGFKIAVESRKKLTKTEYSEAKVNSMNKRLKQWLDKNQKTIVYFPYATLSNDAKRGIRDFSYLICDNRIETYTGRNVDDVSKELFNEKKKEAINRFRTGETKIMYATKAFGMGVDIDDIKNVYHYAATGNLCDYVQEIGRAARKKDSKGFAIIDYYYNDLSFTNALFGMSQIRAYQIKRVLQGIYNVYLSKNCSRNFLISPESFSYIFGKTYSEGEDINKLKTCLLMLEKDFYDKYSFKVLISRPQSVFTKAFVVIVKEDEEKVLNSRYGDCFKFVEKGREDEPVGNGGLVSDHGDIYSVDLKTIWEKYYPNISFPQFKFWYFNQKNNTYMNQKDRVEIMPEIFDSIGLRERINIEVKGDWLLSDLRDKILEDFEYIADKLYDKCYKRYFQIEEFEKCIVEKYGRMLSKIICASLFELVDPNGRCVKTRNNDSSGKREYYISNGNFKEMMRKKITTSSYVKKLSFIQKSSYESYTSMQNLESAGIALKLLSIFDYISYEVTGGEKPEIFIRLNDPNKIRDIVQEKIKYTNSYVTKASKKHDRDVQVLRTFFEGLSTDEERWDYIERYFLGYDVLSGTKLEVINQVEMKKSIDKEKSFPTTEFKSWDDIKPYLMDSSFIPQLKELGVPIAEYIETSIKKSDLGDEILLSWPSKNVLICNPDTPDRVMNIFTEKGWIAFRTTEIDFSKLEEELK